MYQRMLWQKYFLAGMNATLELVDDMKIPIEILKIKDPDGIDRLRAVISFQDAVFPSVANKQLIEIQNEYAAVVENCKKQLIKIQNNQKNRGDPLLKWELANTIYVFLKNLEIKGYIFANVTSALSRDLRISIRYVNYLIEFRTTYSDLQLIHKEIGWDKYKELLDIPNFPLRKKCVKKILKGELRTREDIRKFKKRIKMERTRKDKLQMGTIMEKQTSPSIAISENKKSKSTQTQGGDYVAE